MSNMRHSGAFNKSFRSNSNNASHAQRKAVSHRPMARAELITNGAFTKQQNPARLATPKQEGPEGRTGPAGHRPQCLTSLSAPTRKLTLLAVFQPPRLKQGALATPKQQGPEGRTGPAGHGPHCLTLLSEPTRKLAVWPVFQPPKLTHGAIATPKQQGPEGRIATPKQQGPEGRTWPAGHGRHDLSSSRQGSHTGRARHTETAGPRGTDGACGPRPPLPNVAFWTYKKSSCLT